MVYNEKIDPNLVKEPKIETQKIWNYGARVNTNAEIHLGILNEQAGLGPKQGTMSNKETEVIKH